MNVSTLQSRLFQAGGDPGPLDGVMGTKTYNALLTYAAGRGVDPALGAAMAEILPQYAIDTPARVAHFLAQALHETAGFHYLAELGGPAYFARYDGRRDLGNLQPGDGARFKGRGIFQLTGRSNYAAMAQRTGVDLIADPGQAATPGLAVRIACLYWVAHGLNQLADTGDAVAVTKKINGGVNGLAERLRYLDRIKAIWGGF